MSFGKGLRLFIAVLTALSISSVLAQSEYPAKPIHVVITFPPGGSVDVVPRLIGQKLSERWGQAWVFENRPGAGGQIGVQAVLMAPADGYTILVGPTGAISINPSLYKKLAYDPLKDLVPIAPLAKTAMVLMVPADWSGTVKDLVDQSRARPDAFTFGFGGNGTTMHLVGEMFRAATGAKLMPVPYKTSGEVIADLAGGRLSAGWVDVNFALTGIRSGRARAIAVSLNERLPTLPDIPTVSETVHPGFDAAGWFGLFARAGTPPEVIAKLSAETRTVLAMPDVRERILATGNVPWWISPDEYAAFVSAEIAKWAKAVKDSGAQIQ